MDPRSPAFAIPPDALVEHAAFVRRIARAMLGNDADADDATQETLAAGLAAGPRDRAATRGWLAAVVRNVARRLRRREGRVAARERAASRPEGGEATVDAAARQETLRAVVEALATLEPDAREVVLLRHYDDLPPREIAARLGLSVDAVKKRLSRAHEALRRRLYGEGRREGARTRRALAGFAGVPYESSAGPASAGTGAGAGTKVAGIAAKGTVMAWSAKTAAIAAVAVLTAGVGVWTFARRADDAGPGPGAAPAETAAEAGPPPPLAGGRRSTKNLVGESPGATATVADATPAIPRDWMGYQLGRASFRCPREWVDHSHDGPSVPIPPEMCRFVAPIEGGGSLTWGTVPPKEADALSATLTEATDVSVAIGSRAAIERRGLVTKGNSAMRVRILRLATLEGFDEPFVFVAKMPAAAPAGVDATLDLVRGTLTVTSLPPAIAAAIGDVPGDVIELAVFQDGSPAGTGTASLVQWRPGQMASELEDDGSPHVERRLGPSAPIDSSGRVRFEHVAGSDESWATSEVLVQGALIGSHRIAASASGEARRAHPRLVLALGPGIVGGRAFARDGRPAVGSTVRFHASNGAFGSLIVTSEAIVDADGRYQLRGLPLGWGTLDLELPRLDGLPQGPRKESVTIRDARPIAMDIGDGRELPVWRGRVIDVAGRRIAGPGTLMLVRLETAPGQFEWEEARISRDARFEARVEPGKYRVSGMVVRTNEHPRHIDPIEVDLTAAGLERDLVIGGGAVVVRALQSNGAAAAGVELWLDRPGEIRSASYGAATDREGRARFTGVPAGRYRVLSGPSSELTRSSAPLAEVEVSDPPVPVEIEVRLPAIDGR